MDNILSCPRCNEGAIRKSHTTQWYCDVCGKTWEDDLDIRKEHVCNFLDKTLKANNKARVICDFDEYKLSIKSIRYDDDSIEVEDEHVQYLDSYDRLDELHDYILNLIEKFGVEAEYYDLTEPENPTEIYKEDQGDIENFEDLINQAQLIPFTTSTIDSIEYYNNPSINVRKFMGYITDDFEFAKELNKTRPELHIYTLVEGDDDRMFIVGGARWVNRIGYCFGLKKLENVDFEY